MSWSSCPFCTLQVLSAELERHANSHFEDEDMALARDEEIISVESPKQGVSDENIGCLVSVQVRDVRGRGLMGLLKDCLELESSGSSSSMLSGEVDHFQSIKFEDIGWGCGWRNIQMLASHLLKKEETLFGGVGFVPDIPSLQRWLEIAWGKGFDAAAGSNDFQQQIYGKSAWIGTTECAALLRSFGLRARIVDFSFSTPQAQAQSKVVGPIDRYLIDNTAAASASTSTNSNSNAKCGHQLLANWVWSYFSDNTKITKSGVVVTEKPPLYFQHDGHSRTIVGIQLKTLPNGLQQSTLLVFDPAHKTQVLESCLRKKVGWQRFIKRGLHTLKKTQYQLCYVDPGIATGAEMEKLKTLDSTRFEF